MKKFLVFILLLASNFPTSFACGFYPYGEEVRFSFLYPTYFDCYSFNGFHYNTWLYTPENPYRENDIYPNDQLWFDYCKTKVSHKDINEAVYSITENDFTIKNSNKMIQYLFQQKDIEAITYLKFAKSCEIANQFYSDPWERTDKIEIKIIQNKIDTALKNASLCKSKELELRYKFIAIRLAFYAGRTEDVLKIYNSIEPTKNPTILNYWSLYFRTLVEKDAVYQSYLAAQVYANAPEKRFAVYSYFDKSININSILKHAKTNVEKANVYALAATKKHDKALDYIKKVYELNPNSEFLDFLLLREINKIEDWVFTPFYTNFEPSIQESYLGEDKIFSYKKLEKRINKDRNYANEVLNFLNTRKESNKNIAVFKAQLALIALKHNECSKNLTSLEKNVSKNDTLFSVIKKIKALNITTNQKQNEAILTKEVQEILLENKNDKKFIFSIARELEYHGNRTDAVFLFSKINDEENYGLVWKSRKHLRGSYRDFFYDYFGYIDVLYTPKELENIIEIVKNNQAKDSFSSWKTSRLTKEIPKLYDLLGTKYIRQNNLEKALENFKKLDDKYWIDNYSMWNSCYSSSEKVFDKNPFFTFYYTPDFIKEKENFYLTKTTITQKIIDYIKKANNPKEKNRDYYYFLVANCYRNMTIDGNAWMMRRYGVSRNDVEPFPEDETEFQNGFLAKKYYNLAYKHAKSDKFKSLCLWLAEDYSKLKKINEDDYYDLSYSNCTRFEDYFNSRR